MKKEIFIKIGEYVASGSNMSITTVLGTCVAVCLYDPVNKIGGMNHILLPGKASKDKQYMTSHYSNGGMQLLLNNVLQHGADRRNLVAKVFGGASVLDAIDDGNAVGGKIALDVLSFLDREKIRIVSKDLGGRAGRRIKFDTDTGEVNLRRIRPVSF